MTRSLHVRIHIQAAADVNFLTCSLHTVTFAAYAVELLVQTLV